MAITDTAFLAAAKWGLPLKRAVVGLPSGRERREAERVIAYWEDKAAALGEIPTLGALDLAHIDSAEWSNRFVIAVDDTIENSPLLLYGPKVANLFERPRKGRRAPPLVGHLLAPFSQVFLQGCAEAPRQKAPVRLEGALERADNRTEQYRAVFIPVGVRPNSLTHFTFGAFSSRTLDAAAAAAAD
jgi:hypothetical protein